MRTGGRSRGLVGKKSLFGEPSGWRRPGSSWAPRAASFCWAARPAPIQSWSRTRRRKRTRRSLCGLCTSCCQKSSLSGAECSPWPSPVHGLRRYTERQNKYCSKHHSSNITQKRHQQQFLHLPCCSNSVFCFFRSSMSCWWVWFFRLMYWMYSVALSRICAREACLTEFCQQKFQRAMGQCCSLICSGTTCHSSQCYTCMLQLAFNLDYTVKVKPK